MSDLEEAFERITSTASSFGRSGNSTEALSALRSRFGADAAHQRLCRELVLALDRQGFVLKVNSDGNAVYDPERRYRAFYFVARKQAGTVRFHVNLGDDRLPALRSQRPPDGGNGKGTEAHFSVQTSDEIVDILGVMRNNRASQARPL